MARFALDSMDVRVLPQGRGRALALAILFLAPLAFGALALFLGQDANWDLRNYHWYNAYALVNQRYALDLLPSQTPFFYNPALDVPFYLLATHVSARVAGFVLGTVQGLNFVLLFMLAHASLRLSNPRQKVWACTLLAALGMLGGGGIAQIGTVFYDNITSLGVFASALLVVRHYRTLLTGPWRQAAGWALLSGVPAGAMMGLKLPSVLFCVGLCCALVLAAGPWRRRILLGFMFGVGVLAGLTVTLGPWAFYLQTHYGSPLFPYFNEDFKSPLAPLTSARDVQFVPTSWADRLAFPFAFTANPLEVGEIPWRDWRLPILYALLPAALVLRLLFGRNTSRDDQVAEPFVARYLLWTAAVSYAVWLLMFAIYRYAIPLEMLAPLLIVFAIGYLPLRLPFRGMLIGFALGVVIAVIQPGTWGRLPSWLDHTVEAEIPALPQDADLMVLMAGFEPYSHVVSAFPPQVKFVRIQSNFASPDQDKGINRMLHERVAAHRGIFKLLIPNWQRDLATAALKFYDFKILPQSCQAVADHLYDTKLELCDLARTNPVVKHD